MVKANFSIFTPSHPPVVALAVTLAVAYGSARWALRPEGEALWLDSCGAGGESANLPIQIYPALDGSVKNHNCL